MQRDDDGGDSLEAQLRAEDGGAGAKARTRTSDDIMKEHRYRRSELEEELQFPSSRANEITVWQGPEYTLLGLNFDSIVKPVVQIYQTVVDGYRETVEKMELEWSRRALQRRIKKLERKEDEMGVALYAGAYKEGQPMGGFKGKYLNLCADIRTAASTSTKLEENINATNANIEEQYQLYRQSANGEKTKILKHISELELSRDDIKNKLYRIDVSSLYAISLQKKWKDKLEIREERFRAFQRRLIEARVKADQEVYESTKEIDELFDLAIPEMKALNRDEQQYDRDRHRLENRDIQGTEHFLALVSSNHDKEKDLQKEPYPDRQKKQIERMKIDREKAHALVKQEFEKINNGTYQF